MLLPFVGLSTLLTTLLAQKLQLLSAHDLSLGGIYVLIFQLYFYVNGCIFSWRAFSNNYIMLLSYM